MFRVWVLFGPGKTNFVEKGLRAIAAGHEYLVAADQVGSATYTLDEATKIMEVVEARRFGLYHLSNLGACSSGCFKHLSAGMSENTKLRTNLFRSSRSRGGASAGDELRVASSARPSA